MRSLTCCQYPASVVDGEWFQAVDDICSRKITEPSEEVSQRFNQEGSSLVLNHALAVLDGTVNLISNGEKRINSQTIANMSATELIEAHSISKSWYELRRSKMIDVFTRSYQWRIVNELTYRKGCEVLAQIMLLTESIEADGYAHNLSLSYNIGERPVSFIASNYTDDKVLISHIKELSDKANFVAREELIEIADYIQTEMVETGETAEHMSLVNAILSTRMPNFDYPVITKGFEKTTNALAKSSTMTRMELAPAYFTLWSLTLKPTYLSRFEKIARHCYLSIASGNHYPDLGVDITNHQSLTKAIRFLDENRQTLWLLNDKSDVDKVIGMYSSAS